MSKWRDTLPPVGEVLEVWHPVYGCLDAIWNGTAWRTVGGVLLTEVTHWRRK